LIYTRECLQIYANQRIRGESAVEELNRITARRGYSQKIRVDNGPEFISKELDAWAYRNGLKFDFSRPGKPTDNAYIESFNGSLRDECLNTNWFLSIEDARDKLKTWQNDYSEYRPHSSLNNMTPTEYAARAG
jgi:putative transposase